MIKNLIFDVGGVLVEYRWKEMFREYGLSEEEALQLGRAIFDDPLWTQRDLGFLGPEESIVQLGARYPDHAEMIEWFLRRGEQMVVPRPEIWDKVAALKREGYRIYILSNYSEELFEKHTKGAAFLDVADGGVVSYQVHMVKPDEAIYRVLLEKYGLRADECIFYDDREENVEAAGKLGMEAVHVRSREMLKETLDGRLRSKKAENYALMAEQLEALTGSETNVIPNLANASALIYDSLRDVNWAGFYLMEDGELVLGPFQGHVACVRIPLGRGVCGTAAQSVQCQVVADVHAFPGHIACDSASNSEIVLPICSGGRVAGVLDIDSPVKGRFDAGDAEGLRKLVKILEEACEWK